MNEQVKELLKPIMINFSQLKVGQEVYDARRGKGIINYLSNETREIYLIFGNHYNAIYNYLGCYSVNDEFPSLFLRSPYEYLVEALGKGKEGDTSVSSAIVELKQQRDLLLGSLEKVVSMCIALEKRLSIAPEVLTKQQIADIRGWDVNSFKIKEEGE